MSSRAVDDGCESGEGSDVEAVASNSPAGIVDDALLREVAFLRQMLESMSAKCEKQKMECAVRSIMPLGGQVETATTDRKLKDVSCP